MFDLFMCKMLKSPYTRLSSILNRSQTLLTSTSSSATNFGQGILDSISDFATIDYNNELEVTFLSLYVNVLVSIVLFY